MNEPTKPTPDVTTDQPADHKPAASAPATVAPSATNASAWYRRFGSLSGRTLGILIALVIVVAAASRSHLASDWSADQRFTLSERLIQLVGEQQEAVELLAIWDNAAQERNTALDAVLQRIGTLNPKVTYRRIDPELQKPLLSQFAQEHGEALADTIYITRGKRVFTIGVNPSTRFQLQRQIGGALLTLGDPNPPLAVILQGHGELRSRGGPEHGGDVLFHSLGLAGFELAVRDATAQVRPPADAVVVVAGPTAPLGAAETKVLDEHLQDGGSALILADDRAPEDLTSLLSRHGIFVGRPPSELPDFSKPWPNPGRIMVSLRNHVAGQEATFPHHNLAIGLDQLNTEHPVTAPVYAAGLSLLSPWTSPLMVLSPTDLPPESGKLLQERYTAVGIDKPFQGMPLFTTLPNDAWDKPRSAPLEAPRNLAERGPVPLAWAVEYQPQANSVRAKVGARLVVFGSRQLASDQILNQVNFGNDQLLRSAATWLARRETPTNIPTADVKRFQVLAEDSTLTLLLGLLLAVMPMALIGAAMLTWWDRR